ncbi:MAG TPA: hypothetical protein VNC11_17260 [Gemmatimonadaceae bacterium]|jgi:hypothetical protein|nr:hypothetical protein [Gemmatimonadaceae bacterium]
MISLLAFRNLIYRPWRSFLLFFGYGAGVAVMIVLLSVGEALLSQARDERLVGGGSITVLPQGIDIEVMKTGGVGGLFFSIDHSRFIYRQLLASKRLAPIVSGVAPQIDGRVLYMYVRPGDEYTVRAAGEIPSANAKVGAPALVKSGTWVDDEGDRRWMNPTMEELRNEIDHFHRPPDSVKNADSWAEWHYFNVLSADRKRWAFISFIVGGDVRTEKWGGNITITLREEGGRSRRFYANIPRENVRFSTTDANVKIGQSSVTILPDGNYDVRAIAYEEGSSTPVRIAMNVSPAPGAYFPGASLSSGDFASGYTVPALRASATGEICVASQCEKLTGAQAYHDHNWGVWRGVTWDWGAARAGSYTILYGRVVGPARQGGNTPLLVYLVDSLGFRAVFRPAKVSYEDRRQITVDGRTLDVPSRATFSDIRDADTLRVTLDIEDAIGADTRKNPSALSTVALPFFIQMKGTATISGRVDGTPLSGTGTGFFETYR